MKNNFHRVCQNTVQFWAHAFGSQRFSVNYAVHALDVGVYLPDAGDKSAVPNGSDKLYYRTNCPLVKRSDKSIRL